MSFLQRDYWPCPFCDKGIIEVLVRPSTWSAKRSKGGKAGVKTTWSRTKEEVVILTEKCPVCGKSREEIETREIRKKVESENTNKKIKFGEFIKPMLLNEYLGEWFDNPVVVEPKIDGIRIQLHLDKERRSVSAFTRNGKKKNVEWLFKVLEEVKCKKCILDGELIKDKEFVFDVLMVDDSVTTKKPFYERREILEKIIGKGCERLVIIPQFKVKDKDELKELFDIIIINSWCWL